MPTSNEQPEVIRERNTVRETCAILRLSHATLYDRIKSGRLHVTKDGARTFVTRAEIARYLAACEAQS